MDLENIVVDITQRNYNTLQTVQYDGNDSYVIIRVVNEGKNVDLTSYLVSLSCKKPDGKMIFNETEKVEPKQGLIRFMITDQITSTLGEVNCELKIYGKARNVLTTQRFIINVTKPIIQKEIQSTNEFRQLTIAMNEYNKWIEKVEEKYNGLEQEYAIELTGVKNDVATTKQEFANSLSQVKETLEEEIDAVEDTIEQLGVSMSNHVANGKYYTMLSVDDLKGSPFVAEGDIVSLLSYYEGKPAQHERVIEATEKDLSITLDNGLYANLINTNEINVKFIGAKCDGVNDDTEYIKQAVDYLEDKITEGVFSSGRIILEGELLVSDTVEVSSNISICGKDAHINLGGTVWEKPVFNIKGELGEEVSLNESTTLNSKAIHVNDSSGIDTNDWLLLLSQSSAFSTATNKFYRLGRATASSSGCYLGEFVQVSNVADKELELYNGLVFPNYNVTKIDTTSLKDCSTVQKVLFAKNNVVKGINFKNGSTSSNRDVAIIKTTLAKDVLIENCTFECLGEGTFIAMVNSLEVVVEDCSATYVKQDYTSIYDRNAYKMISSQNCEINGCKSYNGTQPFDITYLDNSMPSLFCKIVNCHSINSQYTGVTTHPGAYRCEVSGCTITTLGDGISIRGRGHLVKGNNIIGGSQQNDYGICLSEGSGQECLITGNMISKFPTGIRVEESVSSTRDLSYIMSLRTVISDNQIMSTRLPFYIIRSNTSTTSNINLDLKITNNFISDIVSLDSANTMYIVYVSGNTSQKIRGVQFSNNSINLDSSKLNSDVTISSLFRIDCNASDISIVNNSFCNTPNKCYVIYGTTNGRTLDVDLNDNNFIGGSISLSTNAGKATINVNSSVTGVTSNRPTSALYAGYHYFDTTIGKCIWWDGAGWVDANGSSV